MSEHPWVEVNEELLRLARKVDRTNAENQDLKARLKAIRDATMYQMRDDRALRYHEKVIKYATTLRMKLWKEKL